MDRHSRLFHRIAPVYSMFFQLQTRNYLSLLEKFQQVLPPAGEALDIGCGSGAMSNALYQMGYSVTGVDSAPAMIKWARRLSKGVNFIIAHGQSLPFPDSSFDLVTAAYVVHGLRPGARLALHREAARLSRHLVLLHDYNLRRHPLTDCVEWLEGGSYFSFLRSGLEEMQQVYAEVTVLDAGPRSNWYLCYPHKKGPSPKRRTLLP